MSNVRRKLKGKKPPEGWELIEEVIEDFETQMKDAVNEGDEGKRKAELSWKIHRLHWEKNRFIFDLMYMRKVMSKELVSPQPWQSNLAQSLLVSDHLISPCNIAKLRCLIKLYIQ